MKRITLLAIFSLIVSVGYSQMVQDSVKGSTVPRDIFGKLAGRWHMTKYASKLKTDSEKGSVTFQTDGTFISDGKYFGSKTGRYTTKESDSTLIIDTEGGSTEWKASIDGNTLRLTLDKLQPKQPAVMMTFEKAPDEPTSRKTVKP